MILISCHKSNCAVLRRCFTVLHDLHWQRTLRSFLKPDIAPLYSATFIPNSINGKPIYLITTPGTWNRKTTKIWRISPEAAEERRDDFASRKTAEDWQSNEIEEIARINWHLLASSKLIFDGRSHDTDQFLPSSGHSALSSIICMGTQ